MFGLFLNDMRSAHFEDQQLVAYEETREALIQLLKDEQVDHYADGDDAPNSFDHKWHKGFRKGGPLEWFNQPREDSIKEFGEEEWENIKAILDAAALEVQ